MFPLARNILRSVKIQSFQQIRAKQSQKKHSENFHDKHGGIILASGSIFCVFAWLITTTQIGIEWNLSPVRRVTPEEWKD
ncbi:unnamed protein product [Pipistrellus nathusii]|uniref:Cytochrome c oxidase subunit VIIb n=1 Tax=Pipistrellus nathusii TaxID=59473 RepID=A0ABN9ZAG2_PIPNA